MHLEKKARHILRIALALLLGVISSLTMLTTDAQAALPDITGLDIAFGTYNLAPGQSTVVTIYPSPGGAVWDGTIAGGTQASDDHNFKVLNDPSTGLTILNITGCLNPTAEIGSGPLPAVTGGCFIPGGQFVSPISVTLAAAANAPIQSVTALTMAFLGSDSDNGGAATDGFNIPLRLNVVSATSVWSIQQAVPTTQVGGTGTTTFDPSQTGLPETSISFTAPTGVLITSGGSACTGAIVPSQSITCTQSGGTYNTPITLSYSVSATATPNTTLQGTASVLQTDGTTLLDEPFTITTTAPTAVNATLAGSPGNNSVGDVVNYPFTETGGSNCRITAGNPPPNLTIDPANCVLSGTVDPSAAGQTYIYTVSNDAADGQGLGAHVDVTQQIAAAPIDATVTGGPFTGTAGTPISIPVAHANGVNCTATGLPTGLTVDPVTCAISGTTSQTGAFPITFSYPAADGIGATGTDPTTITIAAAPIDATVTGSATPGTVGVAGSWPFTATNGTTCSITVGALPPGLTLDPASCTVSGTPTTAGNYSYTITDPAADGIGATGTDPVTQTINAAAAAPVDATVTGSPTPGTVGTAGTWPFTATNGTTCSITVGALPPGLTLDPASCAVSGTPTTAGNYSYTITSPAADPAGAAGTDPVTQTINAAAAGPVDATVTGGSFTGIVGTPISIPITHANGVNCTATGLPTGITVDPVTCAITGTTSQTGAFPLVFTYPAADGIGKTGTATATLTIAAAAPVDAIVTGSPAPGTVGAAGTWPFTATNGTGCVVTVGALPAGLTLDPASCTVSGTPTTAGIYSYTITSPAADPAGAAGTDPVTQTINAVAAGPVDATVTGGSFTGIVGTPISIPITHANGVNCTATGLPTGITVDPVTCAITGTTTQTGAFPITFTYPAADGIGKTGTAAATLTITGTPTDATVTGGPFTGTAGLPINIPITHANGVNCTATGLPTGLTVDPVTCAITGTTTQTGAFSIVFSYPAADGVGKTGTDPTTITIASAVLPSPVINPIVGASTLFGLTAAALGLSYRRRRRTS